ncbi:ribosome biogenesis GTPase Der [Candidatus Saccharibacteria bacterium CPR2]|nr:ribosome biogenesis GTPase Der [Candidatus Saccharibacteria bacterium CPR2]
MSKLPIVAIVGRANVGKSSLFNRFVARRDAIVAKEPGTTRDAIYRKTSWENHEFWVVDTAGLKEPEDEFEATIQEQIAQAESSADVILVVVEATSGMNEEDRAISRSALKTKKPVILIANKIDKLGGSSLDHLVKFGIKNIVPVSALHNKGIEDVLNSLIEVIPKHIPKKEDVITISLVGRPNVGKSFLFNTLAKKQQAIVSSISGTTRDVNEATVRYHGQNIRLRDTAGIRRSSKIDRGVEHFSVIRTLEAIESSDVCLLLIDAVELGTHLDQKIAGMVKESGRGLALVISKWDLVEKDAFTRDEMAKQIKYEFDFVPWASLVFTSSVTGQNVTSLYDVALDIVKTRAQKVKTVKLNKWLSSAVSKHPPAGLKNTYPKLRYAVQTDTNPPWFVIYGSNLKLLHWSYKRYLERTFREEFGYEGTPVMFSFREGDKQ